MSDVFFFAVAGAYSWSFCGIINMVFVIIIIIIIIRFVKRQNVKRLPWR